ncbi:hypothetical protein [Aeromonas phage Asp37]|nr:hypothetical protein [Aeromonas phage Asp37]
MSKVPDVQLCPSCGCYQRRGMLCIKCAKAVSSAPDGFEKAFTTAVRLSTLQPKVEVVSTPARQGMSIGAGYFVLPPYPSELARSIRMDNHMEQAVTFRKHWNEATESVITVPTETMAQWKNRIYELQAEVKHHGLSMTATIAHPNQKEGEAFSLMEHRHARFASATGPTESTIALDLKTATTSQLQQAAEAIRLEHVARHLARLAEAVAAAAKPEPVTEGHQAKAISERREFVEGMLTEVNYQPLEQEVVMALLEDPDSLLNQGLADALDARELEQVPPVGRAVHGTPESVPLTEEARHLKGMDRYLSPDWDIPSCPVIGKGAADHCKHGMGRLDYCPHCEHDDDMDLSKVEI